MYRSLKRIAGYVGYWSGFVQHCGAFAEGWEFVQNGNGRSIRRRSHQSFNVLIYHRVNDEGNKFSIEAVSTKLFDGQMGYLAKHCSVLPIEVIIHKMHNGEPLPPRCVAITFDDGYKDNYTCAFPILKKYGLSATIFLVPGCMDSGMVLWFDSVLNAFRTTTKNHLALPEPNFEVSFHNEAEKVRAVFQVLEHLKDLPAPTRKESVNIAVEDLGVGWDVEKPGELLSWGHVREMASAGMKFGSHTLTHPLLSRIADREVTEEVLNSKMRIEEEIDRQVHVFAYPNGKASDFNDEVIRLIQQSGYAAALTTNIGCNRVNDDPYRYARLPLGAMDVPLFAVNLEWYNFH